MSSILMLKLMQFKRDIMVVLLMAALSIGFIFVLGGPNMGASRYKILLASDQISPSYNRFLEELRKNKTYDFEEVSYDEMKADIEEGKILAGIHYKEDSISILKTKEDVNIYILENLASNTIFNIESSTNIAKEIVAYLNELKPININGVEETVYTDLMDSLANRKSMIVRKSFLNTDAKFEYDNFKHITIGMILFMSMFTVVFGIGSILEDKQYNTWNKMIISPLTRSQVLGGNLIATFIVGAVQILLLMLLTNYLMGMDWGHSDKFIWIILIGLLFVLTTTSIGLFLAGIVKTHEQLSTITPILLTSTSMLGGAMWPLEIVEVKAIRFLANFTPQKWAIEGMEQIVMYNADIMDVLPNMGVLILMSLVFFTLGVRMVKA